MKNMTKQKFLSALRAVTISALILAFFVGIVLMYYRMLREEKRENIIKDGEASAVQTATQFNEYLATSLDAITLSAYTLDGYLASGASDEDILDYLVGQSAAIMNTIFENTTGMYGYINGKFVSGSGWTPPADFDATQRPWYLKAMANKGEIIIVEPYLDAQTGNMMMALAKSLQDDKSVVAFDMTLDKIQKITEASASADATNIELIVDRYDTVIAHSDRSELGKKYGTEGDDELETLGAVAVRYMHSADDDYFEFDYNGSHYIAYATHIMNDWRCISVKNATRAFASLNRILTITVIVVILTILALATLLSNNLARRLRSERLSKQLSSTADIYISLHEIDLINDTFVEVRNINEKASAMIGKSRNNCQQTIRTIMENFSHPSTRSEILDFVDFGKLDERLRDTNTVTREFLSADGGWRRARFIVSGRLEDGRVSNAMYLIEDINAEKTERDKLIDESERAIAASEAKSSFLANMSHEIRTPINAVLGMNEMILRESDDTNVLAYSENIRTAGTTLLGLINDILDFSKIEAGKMEILPVDYDLSSVINDLVNMIRTRAEDKGLLLKLDFDETTPKLLRGDEVRIKQVITNILTNAVKYTEKGSVTFHIGYEKAADDPESVYLDVSVKDTGIGIKPEDVEKLFSEFERIEEKRNRNIEGTGLGMNITKKLLEMMGSRLKVESVYGEGTTFSFRLKQKVVKWDALGDYEASYRASVSAMKKSKGKFTAPDAVVLVVDDTPMNLAVFQSLLKRTLMQIDTAESGDGGLALSAKKKYDIIFLDHMMPKKDGVETLHELRAQTENPNLQTPTVCLTANAISGAREQYLAAGFDDYLTKPVDADKLEEMLLQYLPQEKLKAPAEAAAPVHAERDLRSEVRRQTLRAEHLAREMMLALSKTVDAKDRYTNGHSERVAAYAAEIARRMGKSHAEQERIYEIGLLHDIGKIGIPEELLNKTEHLTDSEFEKIKSHTVIGSQILRLITEMPELASGARSHHERYDGRGYPDGLKGADIPEASRILCLADCYDAMTSTRIYAQPRTQAEVRAEIERCAGAQFDPEIAKVLLAMIDEDKDYVMNERTADIHVWQGCDKLWTSTEEEVEAAEQSASEETDEPELPDWLREVEEIDVDLGMKYCGTAETYLETLTIYGKNAPASADEIENLWRSGDLANTTVKVHAIKSLSRSIGAEGVGALAEKLEFAGKAGDADAVGAEINDLLARIRKLCAALAPLCGTEETAEDESLPMISDDELQEAYEELRGFAESMDAQSAAYVFDFLAGYRLPKEERERVEKVRRAIDAFEWEQVNELLQ